jgi:hypothetical protein
MYNFILFYIYFARIMTNESVNYVEPIPVDKCEYYVCQSSTYRECLKEEIDYRILECSNIRIEK